MDLDDVPGRGVIFTSAWDSTRSGCLPGAASAAEVDETSSGSRFSFKCGPEARREPHPYLLCGVATDQSLVSLIGMESDR